MDTGHREHSGVVCRPSNMHERTDSAPPDQPTGPNDPARKARRRRIKRLRRDLAYFVIFMPAIALVSRLPLRVGRFLATVVSRVGYHGARKERQLALDNLRQAFPDRSESELRAICRDNFRCMAWTMVEFLIVRRWSFEKIDRVFQLRDEIAQLHDAARNGAVAVTGHFGNWELLAGLVAMYHPSRCCAVARTYSNPRIQEIIDQTRARYGIDVLYTEDSPRQFIKALRDGKLLGILPDQNVRSPGGIFVPFFGREAYTSTIPVNLARSAKKDVVVALLERDGAGFRVFLEKVAGDWTGDRDTVLRTATEAWTRKLEERIREAPAQWVWFHDRWQTRPGDEKKWVEHNWVRKGRKKRLG